MQRAEVSDRHFARAHHMFFHWNLLYTFICLSKLADISTVIVQANVELQESSEEGEFRKTKRMSDLLGFSSPSSSNNTSPSSSIPRKCPEVSVSAAPSASKFQEKAPPEKQSHGWKRGQPEPSGPSAAEPEATKRLKVNGRMALNRCIGHRGL